MARLTLSGPARTILIVLGHFVAIAAIGLADYYSGPEVELRPLYLFPVLTAAWFCGRAIGLLMAVAATISLMFANDYVGSFLRGTGISVFNNGSRLLTYVIGAVLAAQLRRQNDALTSKSEALQRESALREEYIALFVHELRHSAAAMSLAVATLSSSARLADDERTYLGRLHEQARNLEQLAGQLLAIGRIESGLRLNLVDIDLRDVAARVAAGSSEPERLDLRVPAEPARTRADPEELGRALDNYVRNALIYSPKGSRVGVEVIRRDEQVGVEVSDTGVGFAPADVTQLFRKYGRLRGAGTTGAEGAGLGLYLTRLIVEAHGGRVEAASDGLGAGACFRFLLPIAA